MSLNIKGGNQFVIIKRNTNEQPKKNASIGLLILLKWESKT